jgi:HPt (histidine-containing phosphotransfer) domain-containing protein
VAQTAVPSPGEEPGEPVNPRALNAIRNLPGPNGAALVEKVIRAFLADAPGRVDQIGGAAQTGDSEALRKAAHAMKSSSANVGAERLSALCKELEAIGRGGSVNGAAPLAAAVEMELARAAAALEAQIAQSTEHAIA